MNIIYLQKENALRSPFLRKGFRRFVYRVSLSIILFSFVAACAQYGPEHSKKPSIKPTFALFGDSISAYWPIAEQFPDFETFKVAFPGRKTPAIQSAALTDTNHYRTCMLNGGVNDFLGNYDPTPEEVNATVSRQVETAHILRSRCDYLIVLNVWRVEPPWPVQAASMINVEMKEKMNFVPRIDPEDLIHKEMLLDGGHLTPEGYRILSARVDTYLKLSLPEFWLQYL